MTTYRPSAGRTFLLDVALVVVGAALAIGVPVLGVLAILTVATAPGNPTLVSLTMLFVGVPVGFMACCWLLDVLARRRGVLRNAAASDSDRLMGSAMTWALLGGLVTMVVAAGWFVPAIFPGVF